MKRVGLTIAALAVSPLLLTNNLLVSADIPVHCLHRQTTGTWSFKLSSNKNDDTLTCGHSLPDSVMTMVDQHVRYTSPNFKVDREYKVTLSSPNVAIDGDGNTGTWTMIYDEGFEVQINKKKYFAFFVYEPRVAHPSPDENSDFLSICDETFSGWYHNDDETDWGCYVGKLVKPSDKTTVGMAHITSDHVVDPASGKATSSSLLEEKEETRRRRRMMMKSDASMQQQLRGGGPGAGPGAGLKTDKSLNKSEQNFLEQREQQRIIIQSYEKQRINFDLKLNSDQFRTDTAFIEQVNNDPIGSWTAKHYGSKFEQLTHGDLRKMLGRQKYQTGEKNVFPQKKKKMKEMSLLELSMETENQHDLRSTVSPEEQQRLKAGLPKNFDWRNEEGNIVTDVVSQGSCGSCYAIAMVDAITMRLRVLTKGQDQTLLSPQNVVSCSDYNQGCEGGYPYLVAKFAEDIGLVPDYCEVYTAEDSACRISCPDNKPLKVYHVKNYKYIGGFYGACNEASMMYDLYHYGPIVIALNAPSDLFYYNKGIYDSKDTDSDDWDITKTSRWEKTNHAVTCIGYGEEDGHKYWIIKNSWGQNWGMDGYFKMTRGNDEVSAESMSVSAQIVLPNTLPNAQGLL